MGAVLAGLGKRAIFPCCALFLLWPAIASGGPRLHDQSLADGRQQAGNLSRRLAEETHFVPSAAPGYLTRLSPVAALGSGAAGCGSLPADHGLAANIVHGADELLASYQRQRRLYLLAGAGILVLLALAGYALLAGLRQRARARAALEQSELRLKYALESAGEGVWDWNNETGEVFFPRAG